MASRGSGGIPSDHMIVLSLGYVVVLLRRVRGCKNEVTAKLHRVASNVGLPAARFYTKPVTKFRIFAGFARDAHMRRRRAKNKHAYIILRRD